MVHPLGFSKPRFGGSAPALPQTGGATSFEDLAERLGNDRLVAARLGERANGLRQREAQLRRVVGEARWRLDRKGEVDTLLNALQMRQHQRSLGSYQALLEGVVEDILGGTLGIRLTLGNRAGLPALDIHAERRGHLEDILAACGGSLINVVSVGLRYAAIVKAPHLRRFAALDEAECWLAPDKISGFVRVISDLAREVGVQTLMITHHSLDGLDQHVAQVRLEGTPDQGLAVHVPAEMPDFPEDAPGLRFLELQNFRGHVYTRVPLAPGVTAITGPNNYGKSAILASIAAVAGSSTDSDIRHGAPEAAVTLGVEGGRAVRWTRRRQGSPKVIYELLDADENVLRTWNGVAVPTEVAEILRLEPLEGLDVQLARQTSPVFLLDQSPSKRALILSVGREGARSQHLFKVWKDRVAEDRRLVAQGEQEMGTLLAALEALKDIDVLTEDLAGLREKAEQGVDDEAAIAALRKSLADYEAALRVEDDLRRRKEALAGLPRDVPELQETDRLRETLRACLQAVRSRNRLQASLEILRQLPEFPRLEDVDRLRAMLNEQVRSVRKVKALQQVHESLRGLPEVPDLAPVDDLRRAIGSLEHLERQKAVLTVQAALYAGLPDVPDQVPVNDLRGAIHALEQAEDVVGRLKGRLAEIDQGLADAAAAVDALVRDAGGRCPTCGRSGLHSHMLIDATPPAASAEGTA